MADKKWEAVDQYFLGKIIGQDAALEEAQKDAEAAGLPSISVTAAQGKLLHLLIRTPRRAERAGGRHPRRLQHDLDGQGAASGR